MAITTSVSQLFLSYPVKASDRFVVIRTDTNESIGFSVAADGLSVILRDVPEGVPIAYGIQYDFKYRFGEANIRQRAGDFLGSGPRVGGRLQVNRWRVFAEDSGDYKLTAEIDGVPANTVSVPARRVGDTGNNQRSDSSTITVRSRAERARVVIESASWIPTQFTGAAWDGFLTTPV